jgi:hypothetical protein
VYAPLDRTETAIQGLRTDLTGAARLLQVVRVKWAFGEEQRPQDQEEKLVREQSDKCEF